MLSPSSIVRLDRQSFPKVKNKKWIKCWKEALITRVLSETTYEVQYVASDGTLGCKSIVHCNNRLKGVRSQAQNDILAEAQGRQQAVLSGLLGVSDEPEADATEGGISTTTEVNIPGPDGSKNVSGRIMQLHQHLSGSQTSGEGEGAKY